jgi:hypothetical protein
MAAMTRPDKPAKADKLAAKLDSKPARKPAAAAAAAPARETSPTTHMTAGAKKVGAVRERAVRKGRAPAVGGRVSGDAPSVGAAEAFREADSDSDSGRKPKVRAGTG